MQPINFPEANQLLGRPSDMTDEECGPLPICRAVLNGWPHVISCWQPSEEERQAIAAGANVYLHVVGAGQPPVFLATELHADILAGTN